MFILQLTQFKNLRLILTTKYFIIITKNGVLKFSTNFYNLFINKNNLYFDFLNYKNYTSPIMYLYSNKLNLYLNSLTRKNKNYLNYYKNYLNSLYFSIYNLLYPYSLTITLKGIGYKFIIIDNILKIRVGYSHFIDYPLNNYIFLNILNPTTLVMYSNNKLYLTQAAAFLKLQKKTNFYKGTGIFYSNEYFVLKKKK